MGQQVTTSSIGRRSFIVIAGAATAPAILPLALRAQQTDRLRRIGVLMGTAENDPEGRTRIAAFVQALQQLGWTAGQNVRIEIRWTAGSSDNIRKSASDLVALTPDVLVAPGSPALGALLQATRAMPIVFIHIADPVGAGFVDSLARPGGNVTGFIIFEYGIGAKWLELLKQVAPSVKRVAVIRDPALAVGIGQWGAILAVAPSFGVELSPINVRDAGQIERALTALARSSDSGLIVTGSALAALHRNLIITLAARHKLPAVYFERYFVTDGGLISYGPEIVDQFQRAAGYVDRILRGAQPADLPVQLPTKYELAINLKTANALGLKIPPALLAIADKVIE